MDDSKRIFDQESSVQWAFDGRESWFIATAKQLLHLSDG
jgi:hypothetical protein